MQNLRLRYAIIDAKAGNMPKDTIDRAIKKGTGELEGGNFEEILYEGYGPSGVAILCDILTDNRNRTAGEVRKIFEIAGGNLGATGCVAWMFDRKGLLSIPADQIDEEALMDLALEAGADDVHREGDNFEVTCDPERVFTTCATRSTRPSLKTEVRQITRIPKDTVDLDADDGPERAEADGRARRPRRRAKRGRELQYPGRSAGGDRIGRQLIAQRPACASKVPIRCSRMPNLRLSRGNMAA